MLKTNLTKLKKGLEKKLEREVPWEEVAEATGVSTATLKRLAASKRPVVTNTANLEAICRYFKCKADELLKFDPPLNRRLPCHVDELYPKRRVSREDEAEEVDVQESSPNS